MIFSGLSLLACGSDTEATQSQLLGYWQLENAYRNGRLTESLDGLFFDFGPDGRLVTNISGQEEQGTYEVDDDQILQRQTSLDADYVIEEVSDTSLVLRTQLRNYVFRLGLRKAEGEALQ